MEQEGEEELLEKEGGEEEEEGQEEVDVAEKKEEEELLQKEGEEEEEVLEEEREEELEKEGEERQEEDGEEGQEEVEEEREEEVFQSCGSAWRLAWGRLSVLSNRRPGIMSPGWWLNETWLPENQAQQGSCQNTCLPLRRGSAPSPPHSSRH